MWVSATAGLRHCAALAYAPVEYCPLQSIGIRSFKPTSIAGVELKLN
jgi:hypothetical protein